LKPLAGGQAPSLDPRAFAGEIAADLDALDLASLRVQKRSAMLQPLDWKLGVEALLSGDGAAAITERGLHLRIDAVGDGPAATLIFPNTVLLARAGEVSMFHVFPEKPGAARVVAVRLAPGGASEDAAEPPPFRRDARIELAYERAVARALERGASSP
jgi:hypothetical protein